MSLSSLYLDAFYACAKLGHFTKAAEELFITQSALSQRIAKLEDELGTSLILRKSSGVELTAAGTELLQYCKLRESAEAQAVRSIKGSDSDELNGVLRIGGFSSVMRSVILPALSPLLSENPGVQLHLITKELSELPAMLKRGEIDYMIHYSELVRDEFETETLGVEKNVLIEKTGYKGGEIYLDHDEEDQTTARYLKSFSKKKAGKYQRRYLDDVYGLIDGVKQGVGRAVVPIHLIKKEKGIKVIDPKKSIEFSMVLHYFRQPYYSQLHDQVIFALRSNVGKYL